MSIEKNRRLAVAAAALVLGVAGPLPTAAQTSGKSFPAAALLTGPSDPVDYYLRTQDAVRLLDQKKWAEAEEVLTGLTAAYPFDTAYAPSSSNWARLGMALRQQGKCAKAIGAYQRVVDLQGPGLAYPGPSNARYWIAYCQAQAGNSAAAMDTLEQMVTADHYLARNDLAEDANFKSLQANARFRAIAGKIDTSSLSRVEGWRRDIDYLVSEAERSNPAGGRLPAEFYRRARDLKAAVPRLGDEEAAIGMMRVMAVLDRGHTALWLGAPGTRPGLQFKPMPVRLYQFPEGLFITEATNGSDDLVGARVLKFGDTPAKAALDKLAAAMSNESPAEILAVAPAMLLGRPGVLKGLDLVPDGDKAALTLKLKDGSVVTRTLPVVEEPPQTDWSRRLNPPAGVAPPLFLSRIKRNHWFEFLPERDAVFVQVNNILPDDDETLPQFGQRLGEALAGRHVRNLILDIRLDNGGNSFTYVDLLRTITAYSTVEDHAVYVIIGRAVYSAAGNFSTDLERMARPVFVGEPTGNTGNQWGDESPFSLPYSGIMGAFSGARWQLSHPWDGRRSIAPQVPVQLTAAAYFAGRDPALEATFAVIEARRKR